MIATSKTTNRLLLAGLFVAVGTAGFFVTRAVRGGSPAATAPTTASAADGTGALMDWLAVPSTQRATILADDPRFDEDLDRLRAELTARRSEFAAVLEQTDASDEQIRQRSEAVLAASAALERRVVDHLLRVRDHLTLEQRRKLFGLCAEGIRQGQGWRWRHGQQSGAGGGPGPGAGQGRGPGWRGGHRGVGPSGQSGQ